MGINLTANMSLPVPQVGNEAGPQYATDVNDCLTLVDQHDHTPGYGVQIPTAGLNIDADLSINSNNLTLVRSLRFDPQVSPLALPADLGCLYEAGIDLYYNDGNGNQIQLTVNGGVAGSPGSISGLAPPASASYIAFTSTFVWQSAVNTPANMDGASFIFRNLIANSKALTLSPPAAMGADYTLTLPPLPNATKIMRLDTSGNIAADLSVDNVTIEINSSQLRVKSGGITPASIAPRTSGTTATAGNVAVSAFFNASIPSGGVTSNIASVTLTTKGGPVMISLIPGTAGDIVGQGTTTGPNWLVNFYRGVTLVSKSAAGVFPIAASTNVRVPAGSFMAVDFPIAGTYVYSLEVDAGAFSGTVDFTSIALIAYEL